MAIVYRHIRLDKNEPFYIGIGTDEKRAFDRKNSRSKYWKNIVSTTDYEVQILFDDLTWEEACEKEVELINLYGRKDLGTGTLVNMTDGGEGTVNRICNPETKQKLSEASKGKPAYNKGIPMKEEQKIKLSKALTGFKMKDETKDKIRNTTKGRKVSDECRRKRIEVGTFDIIDLQTGIYYSLKELCELLSLKYCTLHYRLTRIYKNRYKIC